MGIGNIANTGMNAALTNMQTISNNIANADTFGFKRSFANFGDVYPAGFGAGNASTGLGVQVQSVEQDFSNGDPAITGTATDFSIGNNGFFMMKNASSGLVSYTRYGHFVVDNNGYLTFNSSRLQGYQAINGVISGGGATSDLQINSNPIPAKASTTVSFGNSNLNAKAEVPVNSFDPTDPTSYNYQIPYTIFDSLGNETPASMYFIKTGENSWNVEVQVDGNLITSTPGTMTYDTNGNLTGTTGLTGLSFSPTTGATSPQSFDLDLSTITQFALDSATGQITQDGYQAGTLTDYQFDTSGNLTLIYSNNKRILGGQIALANFPSVSGLQDIGNMSWQATTASGTPLMNASNSNGAVISGTLEASNVDLTQEMVNLVGAQQTFQANAQVEQAYNEIMKTVIQL